MKPVVFLSFANDKDNYLPKLSRESKHIFQSLQSHHDKGFIQVHREESSSIEDIFHYFNSYRDRIAIFHYGGHANSTHLQLETDSGESQTAFAPGLAQLMGQQKHLQLVFLNGCATLDQVELLLNSGVKAVIATSVPIADIYATVFAEQFYRTLASGASIQDAFDSAKAFIETSFGSIIDINRYIYRDSLWEEVKKNSDNDEMPWGLYLQKNCLEVLEWKLPNTNKDSIIIPVSGFTKGANTKLNTLLMETLFNEIIACGVDKPRNMDWRRIRTFVINHFPVPIGEQLRLLFLGSFIDVQRLKQLVATYQTTMELLCFTLLSQLWDAQFEDPGLILPGEYLSIIHQLFTPGSEDSNHSYDYVQLIAALLDFFKKNNINCFFPEVTLLQKSFQEKDEFYKAIIFMEELKREIKKDLVKAEKIEDFCIQGEAHLTLILKKLTFFVNYQMTTIKTINVIKQRHKKALFDHNKVILDRVTEGQVDE